MLVIVLPFFWGIGQDQIGDPQETDSLKVNDSIPINKSILLDQIKRNAAGTITINRAKKTMTFYDQAELNYQDIELKAGQIDLDYNTNIVFARPIVDTTGQYVQFPSFKQGGDEVFPDSLKFNFDNKKAIIWNSRSEQQGMNVLAEATKKENDSVYYIKNARITTSEDVENPDYFVRIRKGKFVPKRKSLLVEISFISPMYPPLFTYLLHIFP